MNDSPAALLAMTFAILLTGICISFEVNAQRGFRNRKTAIEEAVEINTLIRDLRLGNSNSAGVQSAPTINPVLGRKSAVFDGARPNSAESDKNARQICLKLKYQMMLNRDKLGCALGAASVYRGTLTMRGGGVCTTVDGREFRLRS